MTFGDRSKWWLHFGLLIAVAGCHRDQTYDEKPIGRVVEIKTPLGLPPVPVPLDNPETAESIALGRRLFFEPKLSLHD